MSQAGVERRARDSDAATVIVVDLGVGNIGSVVNMLRHVGARPSVASTVDGLVGSQRVVLPGVGNWDHAARRLDGEGWREALTHVATVERRPVLGVCLGMQLLLEKSDEGDAPGLGWIPGRVARFDFSGDDGPAVLRVPHMGWNVVTDASPNPLSPGDEVERRFYFAHSFHAVDIDAEHAVLRAHYGYDFVCGVRRENVWGVQFHPEKSHRFGMQLLSRFMGM